MIYLLLADGFEEVEAIAPVDILRRAGLSVNILGVNGRRAVSARNIVVECDDVIENANLSQMEMLILPGGNAGVQEIENNAAALDLILDAYENKDCKIGAICAAPSLLARLNLLDGVRVTGFPGTLNNFENVRLETSSVVADGRFITAKGAGVSFEFGFALCAALAGKGIADEIAAKMQYNFKR